MVLKFLVYINRAQAKRGGVMKRVIAVLLCCFIPICTFASDDVYYCTEESSVGFFPSDDYEQSNVTVGRFAAKIDFQTPNVTSEKIYLMSDSENGETQCTNDVYTNTVYCINDFGTAIAINQKTLKFHLASIFLSSKPSDTIKVTHGKCEKF